MYTPHGHKILCWLVINMRLWFVFSFYVIYMYIYLSFNVLNVIIKYNDLGTKHFCVNQSLTLNYRSHFWKVWNCIIVIAGEFEKTFFYSWTDFFGCTTSFADLRNNIMYCSKSSQTKPHNTHTKTLPNRYDRWSTCFIGARWSALYRYTYITIE